MHVFAIPISVPGLLNGGRVGGMSHVKFNFESQKKQYYPVEFNKFQCPISLSFKIPCRISFILMSPCQILHVEGYSILLALGLLLKCPGALDGGGGGGLEFTCRF